MNKPPDIALFKEPSSREIALQELENYINTILTKAFEENLDNRAKQLVDLIEEILDDLNSYDYSLGRLNYSGDIRYEASHQQWGQDWDNGPNAGVYLDFGGFNCDVSWHGKKY